MQSKNTKTQTNPCNNNPMLNLKTKHKRKKPMILFGKENSKESVYTIETRTKMSKKNINLYGKGSHICICREIINSW